MMSFEEAQEWGRRREEEKKVLRQRQEQIHREELKKMNVDLDTQKPIKLKYEHPSMPGNGMMAVLFIIGYIVCLLFKDWWIGWIVLTIALGKYLGRHDND